MGEQCELLPPVPPEVRDLLTPAVKGGKEAPESPGSAEGPTAHPPSSPLPSAPLGDIKTLHTCSWDTLLHVTLSLPQTDLLETPPCLLGLRPLGHIPPWPHTPALGVRSVQVILLKSPGSLAPDMGVRWIKGELISTPPTPPPCAFPFSPARPPARPSTYRPPSLLGSAGPSCSSLSPSGPSAPR